MLRGISYFVKMGTSKSLHLWKESMYAVSKVLDFFCPLLSHLKHQETREWWVLHSVLATYLFLKYIVCIHFSGHVTVYYFNCSQFLTALCWRMVLMARSRLGKESTCQAADTGLIPGSGRTPGIRNGNPLQYFCLENPHGLQSLGDHSPWDPKEWDPI